MTAMPRMALLFSVPSKRNPFEVNCCPLTSDLVAALWIFRRCVLPVVEAAFPE